MFDKAFFGEDVWEYLKRSQKPIILYGMGNGADKVLKVFAQKKIPCSGVMASDDFVRGQQYQNFTVQPLRYFENLYGNDFIIAITFGTQIPQVIEHIRKLSRNHHVLVPNVPVYGEGIFDDSFISENREKIELAYTLLADERSREVYCRALQFYYSGNLDNLFQTFDSKDEVFQDILLLSSHENYMDLGAYRGDTIEELIRYTGGYEKIIAVEPDPKTYRKLCGYIADKENITVYQKLIWKKGKRSLLFADNGGRNSTVSGKEGICTGSITIDELGKDTAISYIKMDVEGAEKEALAGGIQTISHHMPKLNIAVYHRFEDIFEIPLMVHAMNQKYCFYLRHHPYIPMWDMNLYCIADGLRNQ